MFNSFKQLTLQLAVNTASAILDLPVWMKMSISIMEYKDILVTAQQLCDKLGKKVVSWKIPLCNIIDFDRSCFLYVMDKCSKLIIKCPVYKLDVNVVDH